MKPKFTLLVVIFIGMLISSAGVQVRQHFRLQSLRVKQGVPNRHINRREVPRVAHDQRKIHRHIRLVRSHGRVIPDEKGMIRREQNRQNRKVNKKKHNNTERADSTLQT